jgi:hypothetical protein
VGFLRSCFSIIENPRVGGSIPPLATINISSIQRFTTLEKLSGDVLIIDVSKTIENPRGRLYFLSADDV